MSGDDRRANPMASIAGEIQSWHLSRWHYRRHGLVLDGASHHRVSVALQSSRPTEGEVPRQPTCGLMRITKCGAFSTRLPVETLLRPDSTEGVPGRGYRPVWLALPERLADAPLV